MFLSLYFGIVLFDFNIFGSGSMEFVVPQADSSAFFPISVRFMATDTFSDLKVCLDFLFFSFGFNFDHGFMVLFE